MIKSYFSNIRRSIKDELEQAKTEISVAVYWFTNWELFNLLLKKIQEGVRVRLIIHNDFINNRDSGLPFQQFIKEGGKFYFSDNQNPMHNKFCIIDKRTLINGSYNWTYFAEEKNQENILIIQNESDVIDSFYDEFKRLIKLSKPLTEIEPISKFEIGLNDELNHRQYLAQDLLYRAKKESNIDLVQQAFNLIPDNITIQKLADNLSLISKKKLAFNIGLSIENDAIKYLALKGDRIPSAFDTIVRTSKDNQTKTKTDIVFGNQPKASQNSKLINFEFERIPKLPKGKVKFKFTFSIDKEGTAIIEQLCLANGEKLIKKVKDLDLVEK